VRTIYQLSEKSIRKFFRQEVKKAALYVEQALSVKNNKNAGMKCFQGIISDCFFSGLLFARLPMRLLQKLKLYRPRQSSAEK